VDNICKNIINERHSTRNFSGEEVSMHDVIEIIDAGRLAPSAKNRQPWSFYILSDEEKLKVVDMFVKRLEENNTEATGFASARIMKEASKVVLVFMDDKNEYDRTTDLLSVGACIENMLLRATELDVSSLWVYDVCVVADELKEIAKASGRLVSAVILGKSNTDSKRAIKKELKDIIINKNI
jgi:nitroreductase